MLPHAAELQGWGEQKPLWAPDVAGAEVVHIFYGLHWLFELLSLHADLGD